MWCNTDIGNEIDRKQDVNFGKTIHSAAHSLDGASYQNGPGPHSRQERGQGIGASYSTLRFKFLLIFLKIQDDQGCQIAL